MEITNNEARNKLVFRKVDDKLEILIEADYDFEGIYTHETYGEIDFEEFKREISTVAESLGAYTAKRKG